jgi:hypothetical protein
MTLSITQFRNLAGQEGYLVPTKDGNFKLQAAASWNKYQRASQEKYGNEARQAFLESISQTYGADIAKLYQPLLSQNGKPLEARHVRHVLDQIKADQLDRLKPNPRSRPDVYGATSEDMRMESRQTRIMVVTPFEQCAETLDEPPIPPPMPPFRPGTPVPSPNEQIKAGKTGLRPIPHARPPQPPAAPQVVAPQAQSAPPQAPVKPSAGSPSQAASGWLGGAYRNRVNKGKEPEEERPTKNIDAGNLEQARAIQDMAWEDCSGRFKAILGHADKPKEVNGEDEKPKKGIGATLRGKFRGNKKAAAKTEEVDDPRLDKEDRAFAELFVKPPRLAELDQLVAGQELNNPLSVYFDLPKTMDKWLSRMRNAETKLDVQQIMNEIDGTVAQLEADIKVIDSHISNQPLPLTELWQLLSDVVSGPLRALKDGLGDPKRPLQDLSDRSSPLQDLRLHCNDLVRYLPDQLPDIDPNHHYLALRALRDKMGIPVDAGMPTRTLVTLANRMMKAHNMLRGGIQEGGNWQDIYDNASEDDKTLLGDYRKQRLTGIAARVRNETGATMELSENRSGEKVYYFVLDPKDPQQFDRIRQADYLLRTIAFSTGGKHRDLTTVFGYKPTTLQALAAELKTEQSSKESEGSSDDSDESSGESRG